jgi:hypothetical protein
MGVVTNASASLRYLGWDSPNLVAAKEAIHAMIRDWNRAADVVSRMHALLTSSPGKGTRANYRVESASAVVAA